MKKIFFVLSAFALLGLASCVDKIDESKINPTFDPETNALKTAFTISVATQPQTKASATTVQNTGNFRGMQDMSLLVYQGLPTAVDAKEKIDLGGLGTTEIVNDSQHSKVYNLVIPVGVNNMVFYAKAGTAASNPQSEGKTNFNVTTTKEASTFSLQQIYSTDFDAARSGILSALNAVVQTAGWRDVYTTYNASAANQTTYASYQVLADLYENLTTPGGGSWSGAAGEIRQGSGFAVLRTIRDLYMAVTNFISTASTTAVGTLAAPSTIATGIKTSIENVIAATSLTSDPFSFSTSSWDSFPDITTAKLPEGAAQLEFDASLTTPAFKWVDANALRQATAAAITAFTYPSELCYWVDSPIRTNDRDDIVVSDYPKLIGSGTPANNWEDDAAWTAKSWLKNATVAATTRAVALQNNIQYANALLESTVQYAAGTLQDNQARMLDPNYGTASADPLITNQSIDITSTNAAGNPKFKITGILVGGQPGTVGWQWVATAASHDKIIYDVAAVDMPTTTSSPSSPIYTMVFDNYHPTAQQDVVIAVELQNNSDVDFWGLNNLIPKGGKFYLVGQLKLSSISDTDKNTIKGKCFTNTTNSNTDDFRAPHLTQEDFAFRVFMQDFKTIANFTIGATSLQKAYSTVPDLRSVQMTFGLSVDLDWRAGATFNVNLGE